MRDADTPTRSHQNFTSTTSWQTMIENSNQDQNEGRDHRFVMFVSGPTASGKTSIAEYLASKLDARFLEGDEFHEKANMDKMHRGEPLTDLDRQHWLETLRHHASIPRLQRHLPDRCRRSGDLRILFLFLDAPESVLQHRAEARKGYFANPDLVVTQFEALERPGIDEQDTMIVSVIPPLEEVQRVALCP
ncbi:P-loop containing nucleoside triphosphate hydrolase protein [Diaporthe sp. PMI_573]|nr:P-loop containing nucleoside triphosphate hydrolase protein [Diaporthaceae sp. PMI_573]